MQVPETEFAHCGDIQLAYQVYGSGGIEVVICGGPAGHVEVYWDQPEVHEWYERIGRFARVALFDRRGTGASDPADGPPTSDQYMDDLASVIDAAGFERPALIGAVEAARMCARFAATYPERVSALVLIDSSAAGHQVLDDAAVQRMRTMIDERWGKGDFGAIYAPSMAGNERFRRWFARMERMSLSPRGAHQILDLLRHADVTDDLARITCPTLVLHHRQNRFVPVELGRALADAIPNARFVAVEGQDSMAWLGDAETLLGEIEEFLTGARTPGRPSELATILFTDIVGSTEMATRLHHEQWQRLLREHDQLVRAEVERCGGTVIKEIGDGVLATFDTPDRAVTAADEAVRAAAQLELELRAGIHVGVVERLPDDVRGVAVHIAARITERAAPGQVLVSSTVNDILVDSGLTLTAVSEERLRGVPGTWTLYALGRADATSARPRGSRHGVRGSAMRERGRPHPRPRA